MFSSKALEVLARLEVEDAEGNAQSVGAHSFWRIPRDLGNLMYMMCTYGSASIGVEIGSGVGYSSIFIGSALATKGGHLFTFEENPIKAQCAQENLRQAGLETTVTVICADACKAAPTSLAEKDVRWDFAFIDGHKKEYRKYFQLLLPYRARIAMVVADNVGAPHAEAVAPFIAYISRASFVTTFVPLYDATTGEADAAAISLLDTEEIQYDF
ncbi:MAG: O-methyltransferase [Pyrinomonadaceae bacterium]